MRNEKNSRNNPWNESVNNIGVSCTFCLDTQLSARNREKDDAFCQTRNDEALKYTYKIRSAKITLHHLKQTQTDANKKLDFGHFLDNLTDTKYHHSHTLHTRGLHPTINTMWIAVARFIPRSFNLYYDLDSRSCIKYLLMYNANIK